MVRVTIQPDSSRKVPSNLLNGLSSQNPWGAL